MGIFDKLFRRKEVSEERKKEVEKEEAVIQPTTEKQQQNSDDRLKELNEVEYIKVDLQMNAESFLLLTPSTENMVRRLKEFLLEFKPDQVLVTGPASGEITPNPMDPHMDSHPPVKYFKERICKLYDLYTPERATYSGEKDPYLWEFADKIKQDPKKKRMYAWVTDPEEATSALFPKMAQPYKVAIVLVGLRPPQLYDRAFRLLPSGDGYFLWLVELAPNPLTYDECKQLSEISDPVQRAHKFLQIMGDINDE